MQDDANDLAPYGYSEHERPKPKLSVIPTLQLGFCVSLSFSA